MRSISLDLTSPALRARERQSKCEWARAHRRDDGAPEGGGREHGLAVCVQQLDARVLACGTVGATMSTHDGAAIEPWERGTRRWPGRLLIPKLRGGHAPVKITLFVSVGTPVDMVEKVSWDGRRRPRMRSAVLAARQIYLYEYARAASVRSVSRQDRLGHA